MKLQMILVQTLVAIGVVAGNAGVAGCTSADVTPIDTTLASTVEDPAALYTALLAERVRDGHVDYEGLVGDRKLDAYVAWLAQTDPARLDTRERLALWINAYNAYTLKLIRDNYPVESINELHAGGKIVGHLTNRTAWDISFAEVGGRTYTLNDIEHEIIRKEFHDPRIHFALVCAAVSCPPLRPEAYVGERLGEQLDDQARVFFSQESKNRFDLDSKVAHLSKILDWYGADFADSKDGILRAIAEYLPSDVRESIEADASAWKVEYTKYDWSLNE
jgi:hypothetical protein